MLAAEENLFSNTATHRYNVSALLKHYKRQLQKAYIPGALLPYNYVSSHPDSIAILTTLVWLSVKFVYMLWFMGETWERASYLKQLDLCT